MKFKSIVFLGLLLVSNFKMFSQFKNIDKDKQVEDVMRFTFLGPGMSYEKALTKNATIFSQLNFLLGVDFNNNSSFSTSNQLEIFTVPELLVQYRFYYNGEVRSDKGKRTEKNSKNYIAPLLSYSFGNNNRAVMSVTSFGGVWGMQRNYKKHFSLDINIGPGVAFDNILANSRYYTFRGTPRFTLLGKLQLGIWINNFLKKEK